MFSASFTTPENTRNVSPPENLPNVRITRLFSDYMTAENTPRTMTDRRKTKKNKSKSVALEELLEDAEFLDRESKENDLHRPVTTPGISNAEPENELGQRLKEAREASRLTQGELSEKTKQADSDGKGISRAVLSFYETGKNRPSPREIRILCEVLRVSPSHLIYGTEDPFEQLADYARYEGFARSTPEFYAMLVYAFSKQHHHIRLSILRIMDSMLQGWDKAWSQDHDAANRHFLALGDDLKALMELREKPK